MILLLDIGNTHTHVGLARGRRILRRLEIPTAGWRDGTAAATIARFVADHASQEPDPSPRPSPQPETATEVHRVGERVAEPGEGDRFMFTGQFKKEQVASQEPDPSPRPSPQPETAAEKHRVGERVAEPGEGDRFMFAGQFKEEQVPLAGAALCSVVPWATARVRRALWAGWRLAPLELTHRTVRGVGIDYPQPATIGPDRLANAVAARRRFGAPVIVIDFGTAVTFDVVNPDGNYVGGIIAPGLAALTDYLHEKTALLPRVRLREVRRAIGRSTAEAMRIGIVRGYRGLIHELLAAVRGELGGGPAPVVATGGYARLVASALAEITAVAPALTLEGVLEVWWAHAASGPGQRPRRLPRGRATP